MIIHFLKHPDIPLIQSSERDIRMTKVNRTYLGPFRIKKAQNLFVNYEADEYYEQTKTIFLQAIVSYRNERFLDLTTS